MTEEWGQRNREAEVTNSRRVTRWVSVILPARFWHSFPCPHSFASIPGFRFIVVTQGVALGWMMERHWRSSPPGEIPIPGTPTAFHHSAQGCEERATLGTGQQIETTPTGLHPASQIPRRPSGWNPVGVHDYFGTQTQGSLRRFAAAATLGLRWEFVLGSLSDVSN